MERQADTHLPTRGGDKVLPPQSMFFSNVLSGTEQVQPLPVYNHNSPTDATITALSPLMGGEADKPMVKAQRDISKSEGFREMLQHSGITGGASPVVSSSPPDPQAVVISKSRRASSGLRPRRPLSVDLGRARTAIPDRSLLSPFSTTPTALTPSSLDWPSLHASSPLARIPPWTVEDQGNSDSDCITPSYMAASSSASSTVVDMSMSDPEGADITTALHSTDDEQEKEESSEPMVIWDFPPCRTPSPTLQYSIKRGKGSLRVAGSGLRTPAPAGSAPQAGLTTPCPTPPRLPSSTRSPMPLVLPSSQAMAMPRRRPSSGILKTPCLSPFPPASPHTPGGSGVAGSPVMSGINLERRRSRLCPRRASQVEKVSPHSSALGASSPRMQDSDRRKVDNGSSVPKGHTGFTCGQTVFVRRESGGRTSRSWSPATVTNAVPDEGRYLLEFEDHDRQWYPEEVLRPFCSNENIFAVPISRINTDEEYMIGDIVFAQFPQRWSDGSIIPRWERCKVTRVEERTIQLHPSLYYFNRVGAPSAVERYYQVEDELGFVSWVNVARGEVVRYGSAVPR